MSEVLVVGAGFGGLAAAVSLAAAGQRVQVIEAAPRVGGKADVIQLDGVEADTGPSVLTMPDALDRVLAQAGTRLRDEVTLREPDPGFRYLYPDGTVIDVHGDLERTLASVESALGVGARDDLRRFLDYARTIWEASAPAFVYGPAPSWTRILDMTLGELAALRHIDGLSAMWTAIRRRVRSEHLQLLLARYATYNGSDARRAPATLNCISHVELALGGYGVEGGMAELARAFERVARRQGVRFSLETRVEAIRVRNGQVVGVTVDGGRDVDAPVVVANGDAAHLFGHLLPPAHRRARLPAASMSGWTAVFRARRAARAAHTVLFPTDYEAEFADIFDRDRPPVDPTVYLCAQEPCHGRRGWPEHEPVFAMVNAPPEPLGGERAPAVWDEVRATVRRRLESAGLVLPADEIVWERTPAELARRFPGSRGALYGAASNTALAAFRRPANRVRGLRGLYLASGSAHPGGGVPLAVLSGRAAAEEALLDLGKAGLAGRPLPRALDGATTA